MYRLQCFLFMLFFSVFMMYALDARTTRSATGACFLRIDGEEAMYPSLGGHRLAWGESSNGGHEIHVMDLKAHKEKNFEALGSAAIFPRLSDNSLVWINADRGYALYGTNLKTEASIKIADGMALQPSVSGDVVVWSDYRHRVSQIYMYDLRAQREERLSSLKFRSTQPVTNGRYVAWVEETASLLSKIQLSDLRNKTTICVSERRFFAREPFLSSDWLVWTELRENGSQIVLHNLNTKLRNVVIDSGNTFRSPKISGRLLVWEDWSSSGPKVLGMDVKDGLVYHVGAELRSSWSPTLNETYIAMVAIFSDGKAGICVKKRN